MQVIFHLEIRIKEVLVNKKRFLISFIVFLLLIAIIWLIIYFHALDRKTLVYNYTENNINKSMEIWENNDFVYEIIKIDTETELLEPLPDWGIYVYIVDDTSFLYFYESRSSGGIDPFNGNEIDFETIKIEDRMLKVYSEGNYVIGSCVIDSSYGIWFQVEESIWKDYKKEILSLVKSATIHN